MKQLREFLTRPGLLWKLGAGIVGALLLVAAVWSVSSGALHQAGAAQPTVTSTSETGSGSLPQLPSLTENAPVVSQYVEGIPRLALLHTTLPGRPRFDITTYTVKAGDTLFDIADKFGLKPTTILWANLDVLADNPDNLVPGEVLNILPVDGAYYQWHQDDGLNGVSEYFNVKPEDILGWPGNHLDANTVGDFAHPNIPVGTWLVIPNGQRQLLSWQVQRSNPAAARIYGAGYCGEVAYGAIGTGTFVWPTVDHWLSGYDYNLSVHPGIDIAGQLGNAIYAADSGVVVYAGPNNLGYGNVTIIDHGNGWQTLYAHQSNIRVTCGQSVTQGELIGNVGSTGNSTGPHLHFEMTFNGAHVNPHSYLPAP